MKRLFFALPVSADAERQLQHFCQRASATYQALPLRWVRPENYHLTLEFLGELDGSQVAKLQVLAESVADGWQTAMPALELRCDAASWMPSLARPRLLAAMVEPTANLLELQQRLHRTLQRGGFALEKRRFRAHVTLARLGRARIRTLAPIPLPELIEWPATELVLYESKLRPEGSQYTALWSTPLRTDL